MDLEFSNRIDAFIITPIKIGPLLIWINRALHVKKPGQIIY